MLQIIVRMLDTAPSCTRAYIDPVTPDDWDILQIHASFLETHLLDQVRVVFPGEELPIWINRNTYILIRIGLYNVLNCKATFKPNTDRRIQRIFLSEILAC